MSEQAPTRKMGGWVNVLHQFTSDKMMSMRKRNAAVASVIEPYNQSTRLLRPLHLHHADRLA